MKAVLEFDLPEEQDDYESAINGHIYEAALQEIWDRLFRPRHKHGYANRDFTDLVETKEGQVIMDILEDMFRGITRDLP